MRGEQYAYRRRSMRVLAGGFDRLGGALVHRADPHPVQEPPRRIVILRLDHLGDVLFATPCLRALRAGLPGAHLTLAVGPWAAPLVAESALVDAVHRFSAPWFERPPRRGGMRSWLALVRWLRQERFDAALDLRGDVRHLAALAAARVPMRLGYARTGGGFWITHPVAERATHEVERNLDLVRILVPGAGVGPLVPPPVEARAAADAALRLRASGWDERRPLVLVHPGAGTPAKRWEPAALARALALASGAMPLHVVLVGGPADEPAAQALGACMPNPPASLVGRSSLDELAALVRRAAVFVGHDSGPAHLAVACGAACVLLYSGVNDLARWGPWRGRVRLFHTRVECSPCELPVCNRAHECMRDLAPEAVAAAIVGAAQASSGERT